MRLFIDLSYLNVHFLLVTACWGSGGAGVAVIMAYKPVQGV